MVYRQPIKSADVAAERIGQAARLRGFMRELREAAKSPIDIVFQSLLGALAESGRAPALGNDFNMQAGSSAFGSADFVPMHQAKVLDRSERNKEVDEKIHTLAAARLPWLVDSADLLRKLL